MRPLEAPSDVDTGPPGLLAPPAAPAAARGSGDTKRGGFAVCPRSAGAAPKLRLGVNCTRAASVESADVEIRHDLPGVFTGNGAAHGQNFKSSAKSEPPTELPGCREWVVSRAQRRARVTQTDARVLFSAILGLPLEQFLKDSPTTIGPICHFCTSLLKRNSVLSKRLSPATSLEVQWRGHRFDLWSGKIPHATEQGSLCARLLKPAQPEQVLHSKGSRHSEKPKYPGEEQPLRPWRPEPQKADVQQRQPSAARRD
ncbi:hypothetical protein MG293_020441 [Ovis ammon polii]|uniref:Uncharacterized protein n=1 Tax=Ovis ammon polii TaxID=230172 RepID=A0AAD4TK03_OVIAM|nr:hypothetical protein MG293_020441 [Ovis ammon polii]